MLFKGTSLLHVLGLKQSHALAPLSGNGWSFQGESDPQTCQNCPLRRATPLQHAPLSPAPGAQSFAKNFLIFLRSPQGAPDATSSGWPPRTSKRIGPGFFRLYWRQGIIKTYLSCDKAESISLCQP